MEWRHWLGKFILWEEDRLADTSNYNTFEYYDPVTNTWENLDPLSRRKGWGGCAVLDGKVLCDGWTRFGSC